MMTQFIAAYNGLFPFLIYSYNFILVSDEIASNHFKEW